MILVLLVMVLPWLVARGTGVRQAVPVRLGKTTGPLESRRSAEADNELPRRFLWWPTGQRSADVLLHTGSS